MNLLASMVLSIAALWGDQPADTANHPVAITVQIKSGKPVAFTADELGKLGRAKVQTGRDKDQRTYEGVPLANILHAAGVTWDPKCSPWLDCYVLVKGADRCNGKPLAKTAGPYQLVEEDAKQRGRWVRQVATIHVRMISE
ncbi:MAG: hypothetical protein ABSF26_17055 [Thermoguttaceae bacterium]|jgi:hypothetical protein